MPDQDGGGGLVERWIDAVNEGIRTAHWTAIGELLRDDAEMEPGLYGQFSRVER